MTNLIHDLCIMCEARAKTQNIRGAQRRADYAMHFFCGAIQGLAAAGHKKDSDIVMQWTVFMLQTRGWWAVESELAEKKEVTA
jgi:hypothetical protein